MNWSNRGIGVAMAGVLLVGTLADAASVAPNQQVSSVGTQNGVAYFKWSSIPSTCQFGTMYLDAAHSGGESGLSRMLSQVVAAYLSGRPLKRVDYEQVASGSCIATLVEF